MLKADVQVEKSDYPCRYLTFRQIGFASYLEPKSRIPADHVLEPFFPQIVHRLLDLFLHLCISSHGACQVHHTHAAATDRIMTPNPDMRACCATILSQKKVLKVPPHTYSD